VKTYTGDRTIDGVQVMVDGAPLDPRFDLKTLSELGFEWGYEGTAPTQLSLALAADVFGDAEKITDIFEDVIFDILVDETWSETLKKMGIEPGGTEITTAQ